MYAWYGWMCSEQQMRLSWWLGRIRRSAPIIIIVILVLYLYSKIGQNGLKTRKINPRVPTDPPLPVPVIITQQVPAKLTKWVIVYTNDDACNSVSMKFPGWTLLIVGKYKPKGYRFEGCIYIGEDDLFVWRNSQNLEPVDSLHVKVLAYLYAIQHGAEYIYLPNGSTNLESIQEPRIFPNENYTGLLYKAGESFVAGDHFGCRIRHSNTDRKHDALYNLCSHQTAGIQVQGSVTTLPSKHSATHKQDIVFPIPDCDIRAPPVTLPVGTLFPFQPGNSMYTKYAFWALPFLYEEQELPYYKTLVWNYVVQKMLWLSGSRMMIHSVNSTLEHNLNFPNTERVQLTLEEWRCESRQLFVCIMEIVKVLVEKHLIDGSIGPILHEWLNALTKIGYKVPHVTAQLEETCASPDVIYQPIDYEQVVYRKKSMSKKPYIPVNNVQEIYLTHINTCSQSSENKFNVKINFTHPWIQFEDVLLIITYNNPHYETIPYIETLYRPFFPYILHCGPGLPNFQARKLKGLRNFAFSFYSYGDTKEGHPRGSFNYQCITGAINMHFPVEGYLVISDDMLISIYKTFDLRRYLVWYVPKQEIKTADVKKLKECRLGMCDFYARWHWWEDYQTQVLSLFRRMEKEQYILPLTNRCYRQLMLLNGGQHRANGAYSDIYYIPDRIASEFATLASLFLEEDIFLEIAIPTILRCLENTEDIETLRGIASWEMERDLAWVNFSKDKFLGKSYLHPTKWSYLANGNPDFKQFYCDKVLPYLHDSFGRLSNN